MIALQVVFGGRMCHPPCTVGSVFREEIVIARVGLGVALRIVAIVIVIRTLSLLVREASVCGVVFGRDREVPCEAAEEIEAEPFAISAINVTHKSIIESGRAARSQEGRAVAVTRIDHSTIGSGQGDGSLIGCAHSTRQLGDFGTTRLVHTLQLVQCLCEGVTHSNIGIPTLSTASVLLTGRTLGLS